jgi:hypothetical protein
MSIYDDRKKHNPEIHEWCYRMINDPNQWEQFRFKDTIGSYNTIITECQKLYDSTPATTKENLFIRATSLSTMKKAKRDLAKTLAEYEEFRRYKDRTAISK